MLRIAVAQFNATVGDLTGNVERIIACAMQAKLRGAQVLLSPEPVSYKHLDVYKGEDVTSLQGACISLRILKKPSSTAPSSLSRGVRHRMKMVRPICNMSSLPPAALAA